MTLKLWLLVDVLLTPAPLIVRAGVVAQLVKLNVKEGASSLKTIFSTVAVLSAEKPMAVCDEVEKVAVSSGTVSVSQLLAVFQRPEVAWGFQFELLIVSFSMD